MISTARSVPNYPLLTAAGFNFGQANLTNQQIDTMERRLNNVQYMAYAMDVFDNDESRIDDNLMGTLQFLSLINCEKTGMQGCVYVAMRRFQREDKLAEFHTTLTLLIMAEDGVISFSDIVQTVAPDIIKIYDAKDNVAVN